MALVNDMKNQHQRPEGALIEKALQNPKKSLRQLAKEIGFSEGRVRQIVNGYRTEGGQLIPIVGPADTVARMAEGAGVSADEMRRAGREDVADEMNPLRSIGVTEHGELWLADHEPVRAALREWLDAADAGQDSIPPTQALTLWDFDQLVEAVNVKHQDELRLKDYFIEMFGKKQRSGLSNEPDPYGDPADGGDGDADATGGAAPMKRDDVELVAHEEETTIEAEQESDAT